MTKQQAEGIYALTSSQYWKFLAEVLAKDLENFYMELETCKPERLQSIQGGIAQTRKILNIKKEAEDLLNK